MRRLVILLLLLVGLQLILPLGDPGRGSQWLLTFGFLILAAYSAGEIARGVGLPQIIGYLVAGMVFGPPWLRVVTPEASEALSPVSDLAIALIAFLAGAELRWEEARSRLGVMLRMMTAELTLTLVLVMTLMLLLGRTLPGLADTSGVELFALSLVFGSILIIHSPAVTMALLTETGAKGPVARTTLGVVLFADVVVVLLFSAMLALARVIAPPTGVDQEGASLAMVVWELGGAVLVGTILGGLVAMYLRFVRGERFFFALLVALSGAAIARLLHVETLLMLLVAGFVTENVSRPEDGQDLRSAMERSADPIFVVFFALAGTKLALGELRGGLVLILPLVAIRIFGQYVGCRLGARWAQAGPEGRYVWLGLVSQAGVALGLAEIISQAYPDRGPQLQSLFLGIVAVNQFVGPILFRRALLRSGEVKAAAASSSIT